MSCSNQISKRWNLWQFLRGWLVWIIVVNSLAGCLHLTVDDIETSLCKLWLMPAIMTPWHSWLSILQSLSRFQARSPQTCLGWVPNHYAASKHWPWQSTSQVHPYCKSSHFDRQQHKVKCQQSILMYIYSESQSNVHDCVDVNREQIWAEHRTLWNTFNWWRYIGWLTISDLNIAVSTA